MAYTLRQLSYAVAVAESGSITDAAKQIGISQPAVSAALKELEAEFGISIFLRQPAHRISLTAAGQRFIADARLLFESVDEFEAQARGLGRQLSGSIEVGCFHPTAPFIMPLVLQEMAKRYPGITVHFHENDLDELNAGLKSGPIEVALMYDMHPDRQVRFETLVEAVPYALLSAKDPLAARKQVRLNDLRGKEMVLFDLPITQDYFRSLVTDGSEPTNISYRTKSYEMLRSLVAAQMGYALLIMYPNTDRVYDGSRVISRPIAEAVPAARYGLAMARDYTPRRVVQAFVNVSRSLFEDSGPATKFFRPDQSS